MSDSAAPTTADADDWEIVTPPPEAPPTQHDSIRANNNPYLDFQLQTRFGLLSFTLKPSGTGTTQSSNEETEMASSINTQEQSPLFRLPPELRLQIYELILKIHSDNDIVHTTNNPTTRPSVLSILETCRVIDSEAAPIFYILNTLSTSHPSSFLSSLGLRRRNAITRFAVTAFTAAELHISLKGLEPVSQLKSLHIVRKQSVRFTSVSEWRMMAPQLVAVIGRFEKLEEVKVITPEVRDATAREQADLQSLEEVDRRLCAAVRGARSEA